MGRFLRVAGLLLVAGLVGAADEDPFPFLIPWDDASHTAVDASGLGPAPLNEDCRITVRDGKLFDRAGRRVRLVGTNITGGSCFPSKEDAPKVAAHLRKLGFNCVRLQSLDAPWSTPNVFFFQGESHGRKTDALAAESLDRLDWFLFHLNRQGIYVALPLHVERVFCAADGFPDTERLPADGKVVGYFEPGMIARQKLYARQLLTHPNPYTKTRLADDPALALIELSNEDSLLGWHSALAGLPESYRAGLRTKWNAFLVGRYATTKRLAAAWGAEPLGKELLRDGRFEQGSVAWELERNEPADGNASVERIAAGAGVPPGKALRLARLHPDGVDWHLQLAHAGLSLKDESIYTLSFAAKSAADRTVRVMVGLAEEPWTAVRPEEEIALTPEWQRFTRTFAATGAAGRGCRLLLLVGGHAADVWLADLSLRAGGCEELEGGRTLEAGTVELGRVSSSPRGRDWTAFLMEVEREFSREMREFLRSELGVAAPSFCSQASYGGAGGLAREARSDVVDLHGYWQHPDFPGAAFDPAEWLIANTPLTKDPGCGTLAELSSYRIAGKPFIVTEYDHPAPSEWAAECVPMIFTYAAWQDWDGVFLYCYESDNWERGRDHVLQWFDGAAHAGKMAFVPAAARLFRSGAVPPAPGTLRLVLSEGRVPRLVGESPQGNPHVATLDFWQADGKPVPAQERVDHRTSVVLAAGDEPARVERQEGTPGAARLRLRPADGTFWLDAPCAKVIVGSAAGRLVEWQGATVRADRGPRSFLSLVLVSLDGRATQDSASLLLTAVDKVENSGLQWNVARTFAAEAWEHGPALARVPSADITLETKLSSARVWALDSTGARARPVAARLAGGRLGFRIGPEFRTLWYEIEGR